MRCRLLFRFVLLSSFFAISCNKMTLPSAQVNHLSSNNGTITMRAIGMGANANEAISDAEKNSLNVLFFRGLPESEQKVALIGTNEIELKRQHKAYFEKFYTENRYKTFVMSAIPASPLLKYKGGEKSMAVDVKVNLKALRSDLEQYDIIRKFGF